MSVRRRSPVLLICCCLTAYFGYHAVNGKHGLESRAALRTRVVTLSGELAGLEATRRRLEREVALLDEAKADPAFVEELARELLGYARSGDRILLREARLARSR